MRRKTTKASPKPKTLKLEQVEMLTMENLNLKLEGLQKQGQMLTMAKQQLKVQIEKRLGINLNEFRIQPDGRLVKAEAEAK